MDGGNKDKKSIASNAPTVEIDSAFLDTLISSLQNLQVKGSSSKASGSGGTFELSPIAKARSGPHELRKLGTKVLSAESVRYWTSLGRVRKIQTLRAKEDVSVPLCHARSEVDLCTMCLCMIVIASFKET
jgi:hypothetical protein